MISAYGTIDRAVEAMKRGAFDFLTKPVDLDRFNAVLRNAVEQFQLRREVAHAAPAAGAAARIPRHGRRQPADDRDLTR
jgi:DNA-binding NtrC family response regulator